MATGTLVVAGLVLAAVGTAVQVKASIDSAAAAKDAAKEQKKLAALKARRARRSTIRAARQARGAQANLGAQVGATGSSGLLQKSVLSQRDANLGFSGQTEALGRNITGFGVDQANAQRLGGIGAGIASVGGALVGNASTLGTAPTLPEIGPTAGRPPSGFSAPNTLANAF